MAAVGEETVGELPLIDPNPLLKIANLQEFSSVDNMRGAGSIAASTRSATLTYLHTAALSMPNIFPQLALAVVAVLAYEVMQQHVCRVGPAPAVGPTASADRRV